MTPKYRDPHKPGGPAGFPVRDGGRPRLLRTHEYQKLEVSVDFHAAEFWTWDKKSVEAYAVVMDRIYNQSFKQVRREQIYEDEQKGWRIWLEWLVVYEMPAPSPH